MVKPGNPIPVVFGVFDLNETAHYLKISKTFAGKADPYILAQDRDQIFYPDVKAYLTGAGSGQFQLVTDVPRSPGSFPALPNECYVLNKQLPAGTYGVRIILPTEEDTLSATFTFIDNFKVITPKAGFKRFYFYEDPILFSWTAGDAVGLYEIAITLKYEEWMKTGTMQTHSVTYTRQIDPSELTIENKRCNYNFYSDSFFAFMGTGIGINDSVDYRKPVDLSMLVTAADTTLSKYLNWYHLEIDDKANPNGNVDGAIGVIGTKLSIPFNDLVLSPRAQDSLLKGRYTKQLEFVSNPNW